MTERVLTLARAGNQDAFRELTEPYRHELQLHCYRIVGSTQDAEDLVQETLLAAWRGLDQFTEQASIRTWLYRIATNRSLDALRANARRPQRLEPLTDPPTPSRMGEPIWYEPYPDVLIDGIADHAPRTRSPLRAQGSHCARVRGRSATPPATAASSPGPARRAQLPRRGSGRHTRHQPSRREQPPAACPYCA